jgi:hypothetical protein
VFRLTAFDALLRPASVRQLARHDEPAGLGCVQTLSFRDHEFGPRLTIPSPSHSYSHHHPPDGQTVYKGEQQSVFRLTAFDALLRPASVRQLARHDELLSVGSLQQERGHLVSEFQVCVDDQRSRSGLEETAASFESWAVCKTVGTSGRCEGTSFYRSSRRAGAS